MADDTRERLLRRLRDAEYAGVVLRMPDVRFEAHRSQGGRSAVEPLPGADRRGVPTMTDITSPAPGAVRFTVRAGADVVAGDTVAVVQVHRRALPIAASDDGVVHRLCVEDGAFVQFGTTIATFRGARGR